MHACIHSMSNSSRNLPTIHTPSIRIILYLIISTYIHQLIQYYSIRGILHTLYSRIATAARHTPPVYAACRVVMMSCPFGAIPVCMYVCNTIYPAHTSLKPCMPAYTPHHTIRTMLYHSTHTSSYIQYSLYCMPDGTVGWLLHTTHIGPR